MNLIYDQMADAGFHLIYDQMADAGFHSIYDQMADAGFHFQQCSFFTVFHNLQITIIIIIIIIIIIFLRFLSKRLSADRIFHHDYLNIYGF